jgi:hypothetical protein
MFSSWRVALISTEHVFMSQFFKQEDNFTFSFTPSHFTFGTRKVGGVGARAGLGTDVTNRPSRSLDSVLMEVVHFGL